MRTLLLLAVFSLVTAANAQTPEPVWSATQTCDKDMVFLGVSANNSGNAYVLYGNNEKRPDKFILDVFDENMNQTQNVSFALPADDNSQSEFIAARALNRGFYVFASYRHKTKSGSEQKSLFAYAVSQKGIEDKTEISTIDLPDEKANGQFKLAFSSLGTYYSVLTELPGNEAEAERIIITVNDGEHNPHFAHKLEFDVLFKKNIHNHIFCTNGGQVYLVKKDRDKNVFRYLVYSIGPETTLLAGKPIAFTGKHITDIRANTYGEQLMVGGFTSSEPVHEYTGYFLTGFDTTLTQVFKTAGNIDEYTLTQVLGKKASKYPVIRSFYIDRLVTTADGTTYLLSEEQSHTKTDKKQEHMYGYTMLLVFSNDGRYKKSQVIKKLQKHTSDKTDFGSYNCWTYGDSLFIVYNDCSDDLISKGIKTKQAALIPLHLTTVNYDTGLNDKSWTINNNSEVPLAFDPKHVFVTKENEVFLRFSTASGDQYRMVRFFQK